MSLNVALNAAVSGLFANQTAIAATAENIANVNTENYARRNAAFATHAVPGQFAGVDATVARAGVDRFLQGQLFRSRADAAASQTLSAALARIEGSLGKVGDNRTFAHQLDGAYAAFATLAANPASVAARAEAVAALDSAFASFARTRQAIADETAAAGAELSASLNQANGLLADIARLNGLAADSAGAADLLDARLEELAGLVPIEVRRRDGGAAEVLIAGRSVVTGGEAMSLALSGGPPAGVLAGGAPLSFSERGGGSVGALLNFINSDAPRLDAAVQDAAALAAAEINAAYALNAPAGAPVPAAPAILLEQMANGDFRVARAVVEDPSRLAIARPAGAAPGGANDGAGATAIADLAEGAAANAARRAVETLGSTARIAADTAGSDAAFASEIVARARSDAGVNLDEELSKLIQFQRAYGANARIIAAVDELWRIITEMI